MKNAASLKGKIKNMAKSNGIPASEIYRNYFIERFLKRVSVSDYKNTFIVKGGFLISSMIGIAHRTTMDLDITLRQVVLNTDVITKMIENIIAIDIHDEIKFKLLKIEPIMLTDKNGGLRAHLLAQYSFLSEPLKIDITTKAFLIPTEIRYTCQTLFDDEETLGNLQT